MATVHLGRLRGGGGFARTVAIKRLHPMYAKDPDIVAMLLDEGRLASRIRHPNVVPVLDVIAEGSEVCLVMEYVHGLALSQIVRAHKGPVPKRIALSIASGVLHGLQAAHETTDEAGAPLGIVHRDVSPHNVLLGSDGCARVADFGIAKASGRLRETTHHGTIKGKLSYMAPEQLHGEVDARADVYGASVVLWECLQGRRLFEANSEPELMRQVLEGVDRRRVT